MKKNLLVLSLCISLVSCVKQDLQKSLKRVDMLVEDRLVLYEDYEKSLQLKKDSLAAAVDSAGKWRWAEDLYHSYRHFSLDSTFVYVSYLHQYSSNVREDLHSVIYEVSALIQRHDDTEATLLFNQLDTSVLRSEDMLKEYLACGIELHSYKSLYGAQQYRKYHKDILVDFRNSYVRLDSVSFYGRKTQALIAREEGEYDKALEILDRMGAEETLNHNLASVAYNKAGVYSRMGDDLNRFRCLIECVGYDFKCPVRNYLSLYELALMLYEENSLKRANKYITANLYDAITGNFNTRIINSGKSQMIIAEASRRESKTRLSLMMSALCCFLVMFAVLCVLFYKNRQHANRLKKARNMLLEVNSKLKKTNHELHYANKIKDGYLFSYMELSIHYLEKIKSTRQEIKSAGKTGGLDHVMKILRSPTELYEEYKLYYRVFDETFLGIFPNFVHDVNQLLTESSRFPETMERTLPTELRLLAAIRLGITESGKIATFLNCAPTTVYTYRTRLKRASICDKDEFEEKIAKL